MSINEIIGELVSYEGLAVGILNEAEGSYRIVIIDGASEFSSSCLIYGSGDTRASAGTRLWSLAFCRSR